jgi:hypothetical protein
LFLEVVHAISVTEPTSRFIHKPETTAKKVDHAGIVFQESVGDGIDCALPFGPSKSMIDEPALQSFGLMARDDNRIAEINIAFFRPKNSRGESNGLLSIVQSPIGVVVSRPSVLLAVVHLELIIEFSGIFKIIQLLDSHLNALRLEELLYEHSYDLGN